MPTPLPQNSIVLVTAEYYIDGQQCLNTIHYQFRSPGPHPDYRLAMTELLSGLTAAGSFVDDLRAFMATDVSFWALHAQPVSPVRLARVSSIIDQPGLRAGTGLPSTIAAVISRKSDQVSRKGRGNVHIGGLVVPDNEDGVLSNAARLLLDTIAPNLIDTRVIPSGGDFVPVIWSPATPNVVFDVTHTEVMDTIRVVRRRTVGVGS